MDLPTAGSCPASAFFASCVTSGISLIAKLNQSEPVGDEDERVQIFSPSRAWTITWTVLRAKNLMNLSRSFLSWELRSVSIAYRNPEMHSTRRDRGCPQAVPLRSCGTDSGSGLSLRRPEPGAGQPRVLADGSALRRRRDSPGRGWIPRAPASAGSKAYSVSLSACASCRPQVDCSYSGPPSPVKRSLLPQARQPVVSRRRHR